LREYAPFIVITAVYMIWNILFSPFGLYRGEVSCLLALCVVAKDEQWLKNVERMMLTKKKRVSNNDRFIR
jgi:hypothetical protein